MHLQLSDLIPQVRGFGLNIIEVVVDDRVEVLQTPDLSSYFSFHASLGHPDHLIKVLLCDIELLIFNIGLYRLFADDHPSVNQHLYETVALIITPLKLLSELLEVTIPGAFEVAALFVKVLPYKVEVNVVNHHEIEDMKCEGCILLDDVVRNDTPTPIDLSSCSCTVDQRVRYMFDKLLGIIHSPLTVVDLIGVLLAPLLVGLLYQPA